MAYIIPSDISRLALSGIHSPELETLRLLKSDLPDEYTVFHGVHWSREYEAWSHFGEIDFVVLNHSGDVLFIEQKNGLLEESATGLVKRYASGEKNVVQQIHRSFNKVREKFKRQHGNQAKLVIDYVIYCPDYRVKDLNAAGLSETRVIDASSKTQLSERIQSLLGPGVDKKDGWRETVYGFFCQTFKVMPDVNAYVSANEKSFVRHTGMLVDVLANLEMKPFRLRVTGTAGSGKSLIARHFFDRMVNNGNKSLLLCYNRPLAERFKALMHAGGYVNTWYGFCHEFLESRGQKLDFSKMKSVPDFWRQIQDQVMGEVVPEEWIFDALVVDEGQDFEEEWLEIIKLFLREGADMLWLEDPRQNLQEKPPVTTDHFVRFRCPVNYRSPESIARYILKTLPFEFEMGNELPGLGVGVHEYSDPKEQPRIVGKIVQDLLRRGFVHDDIVVLSCHGASNSIFSTLEKAGGLTLRRFTGNYDSYGNQVFTDGSLTFDSIYRFKGQEAPAVILVDIDSYRKRLSRFERLLFCGMTRATVRLDLVVADLPENKYFF